MVVFRKSLLDVDILIPFAWSARKRFIFMAEFLSSLHKARANFVNSLPGTYISSASAYKQPAELRFSMALTEVPWLRVTWGYFRESAVQKTLFN